MASCSPDVSQSKDDIDLFEYGPQDDGFESNGNATSPPGRNNWNGPEVEPESDRAWGGMAVGIEDLECTLWWSLVGDEAACSDCSLAFNVNATILDSTCDLSGAGIRFDLQVIRDGTYFSYDYAL